MAVNSYSYGTVDGVYRRVGWLTEGRAYFAGDTRPSLEEVEQTLDNIASEIHMNLATAGYPVNTNAALTTDSARVQGWLKALNEDGAAAALCQMNPIAGNPESGENNPSAFWSSKYKNGLKLITQGGLDALGLSRTTTNADMIYSGSSEDDDGNEKLPIFTRGMTDFPSSRDLTE